jgi:hypothetical protein
MNERSKFFSVNPHNFLVTLRRIGRKIEKAGGGYGEMLVGQEKVITYYLPKPHKTNVKIFTSINSNGEIRDCGEDAIRIVVGTALEDRFVPFSTTRIFRTAPQGTEEQREKAFLNRITEKLRSAYKEALSIPTCPKCQNPMKKREPKRNQNFKPFWGCVQFPECRATQQIL